MYDVLDSLETRTIVRSQAASRPKKYVAVEPETALDRLLADKKAKLEQKAKQYEKVVGELEDQLEAAEQIEGQFWTTALGPSESSDLLVERLSGADERILMVAARPARQFDLDAVGERIVDELTNALERGVGISLLMRPELVESLPQSVGQRYRDELQRYDSFEVRTSPNVTGTFELIDEFEVCIEVPHPLDAGDTFAVIDLKDAEFAASVEAEFEPRWRNAEPLKL